MSRSLLCKLLQRKTYDILSKKHTVVLIFMGFVVLFVAALHFGETMLEWSKEKYSVVFSPYSNNIVGKSFRSMLCQYVPIDVVYTWVNGSDPKFLKELAKAKDDYGFSNSYLNCSFSHCVKSHMVLVRPQLSNSITLSDLEESDTAFEHISKTFVVSSSQGKQENITVLVFPDITKANKVLAKRGITVDGQNYTFSVAHITDNWGSPNTVLLNNAFLLTGVPSGFSEAQILEKLPDNIKKSISKVFIHEEKSLAVLSVSDSDAMNSIRKLDNITFDSKVASVVSAYLVIALPSDHEDISASRFTDNEELRYSLRSLEKHAPWVQHVYVITNGQIPYWLNLDNPWITIVTHEEIFPNKSHLPTFSSPAIECHLHRIPNLSKKFIYLNDDVMFGKDVWPEDFYTHTRGQKVYLSWPVPNCAEGCPSSWIRDHYCDKPCNNSQCQWDGGDCTADNPMLPYQGLVAQQEGDVTSLFQMRTNKNYCHHDCVDTWLADRYCDKACNVKACGFDAGDCGIENFDKIPQLILLQNQSHYYLPEGEFVGYFNLTEFLNSNYTLTEGYYEENSVIRTLAISLKYSVIGIVLHSHYNATNLTVTLKGEFQSEPFEKKIYLYVSTKPQLVVSTSSEHVKIALTTEEAFTFEEFRDNMRFPHFDSLDFNGSSISNSAYERVNISASQLPEGIIKQIEKLKALLDLGLITNKGYLKKKGDIIGMHMKTLNATLPFLIYESETKDSGIKSQEISNFTSSNVIQKFLNADVKLVPSENAATYNVNNSKNSSKELLPLSYFYLYSKKTGSSMIKIDTPKLSNSIHISTSSPLKDYFKQLNRFSLKKVSNISRSLNLSPSVTQRHLLDTFGDSLRHVNKLYNEAFGYEARKVPSHIAHFVDKNVMSRLSERFNSAFEITSSHKIRSSNDMQFAFSYYYFMMSEMKDIEIEEIFDMFDTDNSGTWSDREIRTVLTRLNDLPLDFSSVTEFEQQINNCSHSTPIPQAEPSIPHNERYYDSKLPLVTKSLICTCQPISSILLQQFGHQKRNGYEIVGEEEVAFKMIHNNLSQVLGQIDDLRKHPKKFVCLNDNMNHGTQEAEVIRAVIQDFYESLFPTRSQFELPPEYRNRFLYVSELKEWRKTRDIIRVITYVTLSAVILFSIISFWRSEIRIGEHSARLRTIQNRHRNPLHV